MHKRTREQDLSQGLDLAFGFTSLTGLAGLAGATMLAREGGEPRSLLIVGCLTLLGSALIGLAARADASMAHRHTVARIYAQLHQNQGDMATERRYAPTAPYGETVRRLANAVVRIIGMALMPGDRVKAWALAMEHEVAEMRARGSWLAARLEADSHAISDAGRAARDADMRLAADIDAARRRMEAVTAATDEIATALALGNRPDVRGLQNREAELSSLLDTLLPRLSSREDVERAACRAQERLPDYSEAIRDMLHRLPVLAG